MSAHPDDAPKTIEVAEKDRLDLTRLSAWMQANVIERTADDFAARVEHLRSAA